MKYIKGFARPLDDYLRDPYVADDPRSGKITLRMALSHTSGLPEKKTIGFTPGERWSYSTVGFYYLQRVMDQISGLSFERNMQANLLDPLSMNASSFVWRDRFLPQMAQGHDERGRPEEDRRITTADADSLLTTPNSWRKSSGPAEMVRGHVRIAENLSWGLGWGVQHTDEGDCFWQFGGGEGAPCQNFALAFRERGIGVAIMTNSAVGENVFEDLVTLAIGGEYPIFPWDRFVEIHFANSAEGRV